MKLETLQKIEALPIGEILDRLQDGICLYKKNALELKHLALTIDVAYAKIAMQLLNIGAEEMNKGMTKASLSFNLLKDFDKLS